MICNVDHAELCELSDGIGSIAIAECIGRLGCAVYVGGRELAVPWASHDVEELAGVHSCDQAVIGKETSVEYLLLRHDPETDSFEIISGPLSADGLREVCAKA